MLILRLDHVWHVLEYMHYKPILILSMIMLKQTNSFPDVIVFLPSESMVSPVFDPACVKLPMHHTFPVLSSLSVRPALDVPYEITRMQDPHSWTGGKSAGETAGSADWFCPT